MERLVSEAELRAAISRALQTLTPPDSEREIPFNEFCDCLIGLLADFLAASGRTADDIDGLAMLFRDKLEAALARRGCVVGHA